MVCYTDVFLDRTTAGKFNLAGGCLTDGAAAAKARRIAARQYAARTNGFTDLPDAVRDVLRRAGI